MGKKLNAIIQSARPQQWVKNLALYATILFGGHFFDKDPFIRTTIGFVAFCFLASSNYIVNDILDAETDRRHPFKKRRPVARGEISVTLAYVVSIVFAIVGLSLSMVLGSWFFAIGFIFLAVHYLNTFVLRRINVIDIITIALFYVLRVYAGQFATGLSLSIWLALSVFSLSLLLAVGKRRAELTLLEITKTRDVDDRVSTRYSEKLLDAYVSMFSSATFITYSYYTFLVVPTKLGFFSANLTRFTFRLPVRKWMMITIPFVLYGVMRYVQIVYRARKDTLSKVLIRDKRLITSIILWGLSIILVVYGFGI